MIDGITFRTSQIKFFETVNKKRIINYKFKPTIVVEVKVQICKD